VTRARNLPTKHADSDGICGSVMPRTALSSCPATILMRSRLRPATGIRARGSGFVRAGAATCIRWSRAVLYRASTDGVVVAATFENDGADLAPHAYDPRLLTA